MLRNYCIEMFKNITAKRLEQQFPQTKASSIWEKDFWIETTDLHSMEDHQKLDD